MLRQEEVQEIEAKALDILLGVYPNINEIKPPIDILKVLRSFGIKLKEGDFKDPNVSGAFDKGKNEIYVAEGEPVTRKAFTIAHELGHFILHHSKDSEYFYRKALLKLNGDSKKPLEEKEADCFAASLLMPKPLMSKYWDITHNIADLSVIFGVSATAVFYRLKNLGLINE